ncbi:MAG: hypothetical protein WA005_09460 [Candidatus Binataceae bacterium]
MGFELLLSESHLLFRPNVGGSNRDLERDLLKEYLWHFDLALPARLFGNPHQAMSLQNPNILLNVLEVAVDHFRQLIQRAGMARSNRAHKSEPFSRQEVAGSLNTRETDLLARFFWNASPGPNGVEGFSEIVCYFA